MAPYKEWVFKEVKDVFSIVEDGINSVADFSAVYMTDAR